MVRRNKKLGINFGRCGEWEAKRWRRGDPGANARTSIRDFACGSCLALEEITIYLLIISIISLANQIRGLPYSES